VYNALLGCLAARLRAHWGCVTVKKEARDADSSSNQRVLLSFAAIFAIIVVCIVIPFSEAVRSCALLP
jgi:hypothetical protein